MASGKKPATNKTAHVMNLLSRNREPTPPAENAAAPAGQQTASAAPMPPIMASLQPDAEASEQIRDALESALATELHSEEAPPAEEPVHEPAPEESASGTQPEPTANAAPQVPVQAVPVDAQQPASLPPVAEPQPEPAVLASSPVANSGITYVNVMQALVEEKAPKYIKMFGLCECPRCVIDVKALALNNLPPKYVVMPQGEVIPRITVYEGRYSAAVTAQLLRACKTVMENPRHDLKN